MFQELNESRPEMGIHIFDDVFSESYCRELIQYFESDRLEKGPGYLGKPSARFQNPNLKRSTDSYPNEDNEIFNQFDEEYCRKITDIFLGIYGELEVQIPPFSLSKLQVQKYEQNDGYFRYHVDGNSSQGREMAAIAYFNDVEEGGETFFHSQKIKVPARRGRVVVFPPVWTHPHEGRVAKSGPKYIGTCFWHVNAAKGVVVS